MYYFNLGTKREKIFYNRKRFMRTKLDIYVFMKPYLISCHLSFD